MSDRATVPAGEERRPSDPEPSKSSVSKTWLRALQSSAALTADPHFTLAALLDRQAERFGAAPALLSDQAVLTYADLAHRCRRYTRWALAEGLGAGRRIALLAPNHPDYPALWAGVSRTGAVVSLINTHLRGEALAHSLRVAAPDLIVLHTGIAAEAAEVVLAMGPAVRLIGDASSAVAAKRLDLEAFSGAPFDAGAVPVVTQADTALHIFTSGTTGLPKAARISHGRILSWSGWFAGLMNVGPQDRLYDCLPMYHSVGGVSSVCAMLAAGGSVVVRERFSAGRFWPEVAAWECTVVQYIGELWRYLLAAPAHPDEQRHALRLICGGGLGEATWTAVQRRFAIPAVLEFYASTEGSVSLFNVEGRPGAIGRAPPFSTPRSRPALVRYDAETGAPVRGPDGFCIACAVDEPGEALGRLDADAKGARAFEGYTDDAASDAKRLRDVFEPGDLWYRTGDLIRRDAAGFYYFADRIGDTFRWKGENASTQEVADILAGAAGVRQAAVYGVAVPGREGRAPMAALVVGEGFTLAGLAGRAAGHLPVHARPVFVRLVHTLPTTATYKVQIQGLAAAGFDPAAVEGLYWFDPGAGAYAVLDAEAFERIIDGRTRL